MAAEIIAVTEHLVLRSMASVDAAALAAHRSDPVQARYQSWETPYPVDSAPLRVSARSCSAPEPRAMRTPGVSS